MIHPLTAMVHGLLDFKTEIDRFDVAIAMGAPDDDAAAWGAYLQTAAHVLDCMAREGSLHARQGVKTLSYAANEPPTYLMEVGTDGHV